MKQNVIFWNYEELFIYSVENFVGKVEMAPFVSNVFFVLFFNTGVKT